MPTSPCDHGPVTTFRCEIWSGLHDRGGFGSGGIAVEKPADCGDHSRVPSVDVNVGEMQQRPAVLGEPVVSIPVGAQLILGQMRDTAVVLGADSAIAPSGIQPVPPPTHVSYADLARRRRKVGIKEALPHA